MSSLTQTRPNGSFPREWIQGSGTAMGPGLTTALASLPLISHHHLLFCWHTGQTFLQGARATRPQVNTSDACREANAQTSVTCGHTPCMLTPSPGASIAQGTTLLRGCGHPPAIAWGSAEYSCTSTTQQSRAAFSFFSLEAEGATRKSPYQQDSGSRDSTVTQRHKSKTNEDRKSTHSLPPNSLSCIFPTPFVNTVAAYLLNVSSSRAGTGPYPTAVSLVPHVG